MPKTQGRWTDDKFPEHEHLWVYVPEGETALVSMYRCMVCPEVGYEIKGEERETDGEVAE